MADVPSQKDFRAMIESLPPSKLDIDDVMRRGRRYRLLSRMGAALSIASVAIIVASAGILIAGKDAERLVDEGAPQGQRGVPPTSDEGSGPSSPLARGFPVWSDLPPLDQPTDTRLYLSDGPRLTVVDVDAADAKTHRLAWRGAWRRSHPN